MPHIPIPPSPTMTTQQILQKLQQVNGNIYNQCCSYNSAKYTDTSEIQKRIDNYSDLFNRESTNCIRKIEINDNDYLPSLYERYLTAFY